MRKLSESRAIDEVTIHHTETDANIPLDKILASLSRTHKRKFGESVSCFWYTISYHYLITKDGQIVPTRCEKEMWRHNRQNNQSSIGVSLIWDFNTWKPTDAQYQAVNTLLLSIKNRHPNFLVMGHRPNDQDNDCPGKNFDFSRITQAKIAIRGQTVPKTKPQWLNSVYAWYEEPIQKIVDDTKDHENKISEPVQKINNDTKTVKKETQKPQEKVKKNLQTEKIWQIPSQMQKWIRHNQWHKNRDRENFKTILAHDGYSKDSLVQKLVNYAYSKGQSLDFVRTLDAENGGRAKTLQSKVRDANGREHSYWLCQLNKDRHASFLKSQDFDNYYNQIDYCWDVRTDWEQIKKKKGATNPFHAYYVRNERGAEIDFIK